MSARLQTFGVVCIVLLLVVSLLTLRAVRHLAEPAPQTTAPPADLSHGLETSWRSAQGQERVWSLTGPCADYKPWLAGHVELVHQVQDVFPKLQEK